MQIHVIQKYMHTVIMYRKLLRKLDQSTDEHKDNKRPTGLNGHFLNTIAHTQTCGGISCMHLSKIHSGVKGL